MGGRDRWDPPALPPRPGDSDRPEDLRELLHSLERTVKTISDTVSTMFESWPMLLKTQGDICSQLRDHERRIHRVEQRANIWIQRKEETVEDAWASLDASNTGTHARVTRSDVERLLVHRDLKKKAQLVDWAGRHAGKVVTHALTALVAAATAFAWHWLARR